MLTLKPGQTFTLAAEQGGPLLQQLDPIVFDRTVDITSAKDICIFSHCIHIPPLTATVNIGMDPQITLSQAVGSQSFGVDGTVNFNSGTGNLVFSPQTPPPDQALFGACGTLLAPIGGTGGALFAFCGSAAPAFSSSNSLAGPLVDLLDSSSPAIAVGAKETLTSVTADTSGTIISDSTAILFLENFHLAGSVSYYASIQFDNSTVIGSLLGSTIEPLIDNAIGSEFAGYLADSLLPPLLDNFFGKLPPIEGSSPECNVTSSGASVDWSCDYSGLPLPLLLTGSLAGTPGSVPEPATLALLGLAFAGIGWTRRRKPN